MSGVAVHPKRRELRDRVREEVEEGIRVIRTLPGRTQTERDEAIADLVAEGIDAATDTGPLDAVDDEAIRQGVLRIQGLLWKLFQKDPAKMRERAQRCQARGDGLRAQQLLDEAQKLEERRGNGQ